MKPTHVDLNFHHLRYFWAVARAGSIAQASRELRLSAPALSVQVQALEASLADIRQQAVSEILCLGDVVGWGAVADDLLNGGDDVVAATVAKADVQHHPVVAARDFNGVAHLRLQPAGQRRQSPPRTPHAAP